MGALTFRLGVATEALQVFLVYFQVKVLRSLRSIRDYDSKVDLRNLIDASNFARMESIAVLDESSLRLAQAATVAKRFVEESGMQTSHFTPKSPLNIAGNIGNAPWQKTARTLHMPPEKQLVLPLRGNAPHVPLSSGFVGALSPEILRSDPGDFCRGAYYLMEGQYLKSLKVETRMESKIGQSQFWSCAIPDCAFEGPACKVGETQNLDDTVREDRGVRYRWSFLVKCHLPSETLNEKMQDSFKCILCIRGKLPLLRYRSEATFMEHVASHAGQRFDWFIEQNIDFICGRTALQGEAFDINFPSPIRDIGPVFSVAPLQRMAHVNFVPVTTLRTDATTPVTNQGSDKNCQRSRSKTRKSFDEDGHASIGSKIMNLKRQALVGEHLSQRDTRDAAKACQIHKGKPTATTETPQPSSRGRLVDRKLSLTPCPSSSDTSSIHSGNTYDSSTHGSKDDSSMTSVEEGQMETQVLIDDDEYFVILDKLQEKAKNDCKGDSAGRMVSLKPLDPCKHSESRVEAGPPHVQESSARISGPETILSYQLSSNLEDFQAASDTPISDQFTNHKQGSLTKEDIAASGRTSSQPAMGINFHPKPVYEEDCEIEELGDALGQGKTNISDYSDFRPIAASDAVSSESGKDANELIGRMEEDSNVYNSHPQPSLGKHLVEDSTGSYSIVQPAKDMKLSKHAEEIQYHANDEKLSFRVDTNDNDAVIQMRKSATQYKSHDELGRTVRVPSWDFIFKQVFPLAVLVGTHFIRLYEAKYHNSKAHNQIMNEKHNIYLTSVQMVAWMAVLYSMSKLLASRLVMLASPYRQDRNNEVGDPTLRLSKSLRILNGQEYSIFNSAKLYIEHSTEKQWDWWPFVASFRPLQPDEVRVEWECVSDQFFMNQSSPGLTFNRKHDTLTGSKFPRNRFIL